MAILKSFVFCAALLLCGKLSWCQTLQQSYGAGNASAFLAQAYVYRLALQKKLSSPEVRLRAEELSPIVLEALVYFGICHFAMAQRLLDASLALLPRVDDSAKGPVLAEDLRYLRQLQRQLNEKQKRLARDQNVSKAPSHQSDAKWYLPSGQKPNLSSAERVSSQLRTHYKNRCPKPGEAL